MTVPTDPRLQASLALKRARDAQEAGNMPVSEDLFREAMWLDPSNAEVYYGLSWLAYKAGRGDEMLRYIELALTINANNDVYHFTHGMAQGMLGNLDYAMSAYRRALKVNSYNIQAQYNLIFTADIHPSTTPEYALALRREFDERFCRPLYEARQSLGAPKNRPDPDRRLRIGYVSGDFRAHSAAAAFAPMVMHHDREQFEVYLYSTHNPEGGEDQRDLFRENANWRDIENLSPGEQAQEIADDRLDILIDLSGYSAGSAIQAIAMKPAPITVSAWGYLTGTGVASIDYLFADPVTVPPELERHYSETIVHMPAIFPYAHQIAPAIRTPAPLERNGYKTYGYLGRGTKVTWATLDAWAMVLRADPESRMLVKSDSYRQREMYRVVLNGLLARGIDNSRVTVLFSTMRDDHLLAHNDVDVMLDAVPQCGGISTCDALLMGVPVVTLAGKRLPERVGASILTSIGYAGLVASTVDEYARIALALQPTVEDRQAIRAALGTSPLLDHAGYLSHVEETYRALWRRWCEHQAAPSESEPTPIREQGAV